jgi:hypothetical protein
MDHPKPQKPAMATPALGAGSRPSDAVSLFRTGADVVEDAVPVGLPMAALGTRAPKRGNGSSTAVIDLSGRPKVWFVIGRGRTGKTMLLP